MARRPGGRAPDEAREVRIQRGFTRSAPGSVLIEAGRTQILCTASWTETVPAWLSGVGHGWLTAEYSMLPASTHNRKVREGRNGRVDGRSMEIQRLIGRALRAAVDVKRLPEISIWVDCDVLSADGGTRTLAITGAYVALEDLVGRLLDRGRLQRSPIQAAVCATSVGLVGGEPLLDLCFEEDHAAMVDMNVVYTSAGEFAEVQATGEKGTLARRDLDALLDLAEQGCKGLLEVQQQALRA
ncbi:MAG: ribonuclease PH [Planctomycetota bacterium]